MTDQTATAAPMPDEELEEIRDALDSLSDAEFEYSMPRDISRLLDEVNRLRSMLVQAAAELHRQWQHAVDAYDAKTGPEWTQEHALFCKGKALGAVKALQASMTGPGDIDGNCDAAWKAVDEYLAAKAGGR